MDVDAIYSAFLKVAGVEDYKRICKAEFNELKCDSSNIRLFELKFFTALVDAGLESAANAGKLEMFLEKLPENLSTAIANITDIDTTAKAVEWIISYGHTLTPVNAVTTGPTAQEVAALQQEIEDLKAMMAQASINATAPAGRGNGSKKCNKGGQATESKIYSGCCSYSWTAGTRRAAATSPTPQRKRPWQRQWQSSQPTKSGSTTTKTNWMLQLR